MKLADALAQIVHRRLDQEPYRFHDLAQYNAECGRGIIHTDEWKARMAEEQVLFDSLQQQEHSQ